MPGDLTGLEFGENVSVDPERLNRLYLVVGWDETGRRTAQETLEMLEVSRYYISAHTESGDLVGFARVCGDPYVAQVLDVITDPGHRRRGIASRCMARVKGHLVESSYVSVTLTDGTCLPHFYEAFGFRFVSSDTPTRVWRR